MSKYYFGFSIQDLSRGIVYQAIKLPMPEYDKDQYVYQQLRSFNSFWDNMIQQSLELRDKGYAISITAYQPLEVSGLDHLLKIDSCEHILEHVDNINELYAKIGYKSKNKRIPYKYLKELTRE